MAVAHDAVSESHTGTSPSVSEASFSWTHTPSADPHGVLVFVFTLNFGANFSTNVTYGGVPLIWMNQAVTDAAGEPGFVTVYMLGQGLPTGAQSVVVSRTNNTGEMYAVAVTVTENTVGRTLLHEATAYISGDGTLNQLSVTDGSPGQNSVRYVGNFFGLNAVPAPGADSTALVDILVASARGAAVVRETTAGQGSRPVGFSDGTSDDRASLGVAFRVMLDQFVGQAWPFGIYYSAQMRGPFWMDTARGAIIGVDWNADPAAWYTTDGGDSWTKSVLENVTIEGIAACFDGEVFGDNGTLIHVAYTCSTEQDLSVAQFDLATMTWSAVVDLNTALGAANYNSPIIQKTQGGSWYVSCHNTGATRYAYRNSGDFLTSGDWSAATSPWEADGSLDYARAFCGDTDDPDDFGIIFHDITAAEISIKMYDWGTDTWTEQVFQTSLTYQNYTTYMSVKVRHSDKRVFVVNWNASSSANLITRRFLPTTSDATALTITTNTNNVYTGATPNSCDLLIDQFSGDVYVCYGRTATSFTLYYKRSTDNGDNWGAETQYLVHTGQASYTVAAGAFGPTNGGRFAPAILRYSMNWIVVPAASSALTFHPYVPPEPVQLSGPRPFLLLEGADEPYIPVAAAVSAQRSIASVLSDLTSIPPEIEDEGFAVPPLTPAALSLELFPATQQGFIDRMSALRTIAGVLLDLTSITPEVEDQQSVRRALELKWQEYPALEPELIAAMQTLLNLPPEVGARTIASVLADLTSITPEIEDQGLAFLHKPVVPEELAQGLRPATEQGWAPLATQDSLMATVFTDLTSIPAGDDPEAIARAAELELTRWSVFPVTVIPGLDTFIPPQPVSSTRTISSVAIDLTSILPETGEHGIWDVVEREARLADGRRVLQLSLYPAVEHQFNPPSGASAPVNRQVTITAVQIDLQHWAVSAEGETFVADLGTITWGTEEDDLVAGITYILDRDSNP